MPNQPLTQAPAAERAARELYGEVLRCWNQRDAAEFARLFSRNGNMVGFDGSPIDGQENIEEHLSEVFRSHPTAAYIGKVRAGSRAGSRRGAPASRCRNGAAGHSRPEPRSQYYSHARRRI